MLLQNSKLNWIKLILKLLYYVWHAKDLYKYCLLGHNKKQTTEKQKQNVKGKGSYVIIAKVEVI